MEVGSTKDGKDGDDANNANNADLQIEELQKRLLTARERISKAGTRRGVLGCKRRELSTLRDELNHRVNALTLERREMTHSIQVRERERERGLYDIHVVQVLYVMVRSMSSTLYHLYIG